MFRDGVGDLGLLTKKPAFCIGSQKSGEFTNSPPRTFLPNHSGAPPPACGVLCAGGGGQLGALALFIPELSFLVPASVYRGRMACTVSSLALMHHHGYYVSRLVLAVCSAGIEFPGFCSKWHLTNTI